MNYAMIKSYDIADGPGVRVSLFVSGCTHHCAECFNPETWDFAYGEPFTAETAARILHDLAPVHIQGLTLLGGEPFEPQNEPTMCALARQVRQAYPQKNIWAYSGYPFEQLLARGSALLPEVDILVDGPFVKELKNLNLRFRGSSNQRILDVAQSLRAGAPVHWEGESDT
ncbi:MAG: anaerobic ribonucleoside-triphosphate reductase activating protein [Oscillospiraceae bacterium]|nr:anaerobic ribonucleoside-triphosphate reductase activating protein [Oscillospiraceae bacterium]